MGTKPKPTTEVRGSKHRSNHPYAAYEGSPLWKAVSKAITELVENGDLSETTARSYIVGYVCKEVSKANKLKA